MQNIFDSHCHYSDEAFDADRNEILSAMKDGGVSYLLHAGTNSETNRFGVSYAKKYDFFYTSVGIHPEDIPYASEADFLEAEKLLSEEKVVAVGEIGLDYHYEGYDREKQIYAFERQLDMAKAHNLPVIIHSRDATADCMNILKKHKPRGVMHCFSGSAETAREVLALGMYISFTGVVTFKNARKAQESVMAIPIDRLLLETDCPYMAPEPNRGKRCDSRMIAYTAAKIGELKGLSAQEIIDAATENTKRLFNII